MEKKQRVGIFGGSFDPIHIGHLNLAVECLEKCHLDQVWFVPANISPHKTDRPPVSADHRLQMVRIAAASFPCFEVKEEEIRKEGPSYSLFTLQHLTKEYPHIAFSLIIGEDSLGGFLDWREPREIVKLASLIVGCRNSSAMELFSFKNDPMICQAIENGLVRTRMMEISSTEVRDRLRRGLCCSHLVLQPVLEYIARHKLYQSSSG